MIQHQLVMVRGDTRTFDLSDLVDFDGLAYDWAGATVTFTVDGLFEKTRGAGIAIDESSETVTLTVSGDDTTGAPDHRRAYRYDVQVVLSDGTVETPRRGQFVVLPDVTVET